MIEIVKSAYYWRRNYFVFKRFLKKNIFNLNNRQDSSKGYIFLIEPWKVTPLPWYAMTLSLLIFKKGFRVKILINDFNFESIFLHKIQIHYILKISKYLPNKIDVELLSTIGQSEEADSIDIDNDKLMKLALANAIHRNKGELKTEEFDEEVRKYYLFYKNANPFIGKYLFKNKNNFFVIPGGIYGYTGIFLEFIKNIGIEYFTYDSGFGTMLTSFNGVAAHCKDTGIVAKIIANNLNEEENVKINYIANDELNKRINGTNSFKTQYQKIEDSVFINDVGFLIPLNSPWDSAALNIDLSFKSYRDWLIETVKVILDNSNYNITIRQHPDERHWYGKSNLDFGEILKAELGSLNRVNYISCYDKVNTYALLGKCIGVICFSSTFGVEAALLGKKVLVCSDVYYSDLSFVTKIKEKEQLISEIRNMNKSLLNDEQKQMAAITFYLGQRCNWLHTNFTPTPNDFFKWSELNIDDLYKDLSVKMLVDAIVLKTPICLVNHKSMMSKI